MVSRSDRAEHILAAYQHYDYLDNEAFTFGGQSIGASFLSRFMTERGFETRTEFHANAIISERQNPIISASRGASTTTGRASDTSFARRSAERGWNISQ